MDLGLPEGWEIFGQPIGPQPPKPTQPNVQQSDLPDGWELAGAPSWGETLGQSAVKGAVQGTLSGAAGVRAAKAGNVAAPEATKLVQPAEDHSKVGELLNKPVDWSDPKSIAAQATSGLAANYPSLLAGGAGAALGGTAAGPLGATIGGASGFAAGNAFQSIVPAYVQGLQEGLSHDKALDRAWKDAGISAAAGALMGGAAGVKLLKSQIGDYLATMFVKMPGIMAGQKAAKNYVAGKPLSEGTGEAALMGAVTGLPLVGIHALEAGGRAGIERATESPVDAFVREANRYGRTAGPEMDPDVAEGLRQAAARDAQRNPTPALPPPGEVEGSVQFAPEQEVAPPSRDINSPVSEAAPPPVEPNMVPEPVMDEGAPAAPPADLNREHENAALRGIGWTDDEIDGANSRERAKGLKEANYAPPPDGWEIVPQETAPAAQEPVAEPEAPKHAPVSLADVSLLKAAGLRPDTIKNMSPQERADFLAKSAPAVPAPLSEDDLAALKPVLPHPEQEGRTADGRFAATERPPITEDENVKRGLEIAREIERKHQEQQPEPAPNAPAETPVQEAKPAQLPAETAKAEAPAVLTAKTQGKKQAPPQSLIQFLKSAGGVRDEGGDLQSAELHKKHIGLVSKRGLPMDKAREAAAEAGYLGANTDRAMAETTVNDLIDAIHDHPRYSVHDQELVAERENAAKTKEAEQRRADDADAQLRDHLGDLYDEFPEKELAHAARLIAEQGHDPETALTAAIVKHLPKTPKVRKALPDIPFPDVAPQEKPNAEAAAATPDAGAASEPRAGAGGERQRGEERRGKAPVRAKPEERPRAGETAGEKSKEPVLVTKTGTVGTGRKAQTVPTWAVTFEKDGRPHITSFTRYKGAAERWADTIRQTGWTVEGRPGQYDAEMERAGKWTPVEAQKPAAPTYEPGAENKPQGRAEKLEAKREKKAAAVPESVANSIRDMSKRNVAAFDNLVENIGNFGKIGEDDAKLVANYYLKNKIASLDPVTGRPSIKRGEFYDKDVIERALAQAKPVAPTYEPGAENKPQAVVPGAEKIGQKTHAERLAAKPMRGKVPQREAGGMFDEANTGKQLFDEPAEPSYETARRQAEAQFESPAEFRRAAEIVKDIVERVLPPGAVRTWVDERAAFPTTPEALQRHGLGGGYATGSYNYLDKLIKVAVGGRAPEAISETAYHEAWHAVQDLGLASEDELRVLRSPAEQARLRKIAAERVGAERAASMDPLELEAQYLGRYSAAKDAGQEPPRGLHAKSMALFERIYALFRRIRNALKGAGFQTVEDIFDRFRSGEMAQRPREERGPSRMTGEYAEAAEPPAGDKPERDRLFEQKKAGLYQKFIDAKPKLLEKLSHGKDQLIDFNHAVEQMKDIAFNKDGVPGRLDPYWAKRLMPGKKAARHIDFEAEHVEPLKRYAEEHGLTAQDIDEWLYASHAPDRNRVIDRVNPAMGGMGSGISDEHAQEIIDDLTAKGKAPALSMIADKVEGIRQFWLDNALENGLMSESEVNKLKRVYPKGYVPLIPDDEASPTEKQFADKIAAGANLRSKEYKHAYGLSRVPGSPLSNLINMAHRGIDRAAENDARKTVVRFLQSQVDPKTREALGIRFDKAKMVPQWSAAQGRTLWVDEHFWKNAPETVEYKINGNVHYINFEGDARTAQAIRMSSPDRLDGMARYLAAALNVKKGLVTHLNPEFFLGHFLARYPLEGALNAGEHGYGRILSAFKSYPVIGPAYKAIRNYRGGVSADVNDPWMRAYHEMRQAGGLQNFEQFGGYDRIHNSLITALNDRSGSPTQIMRRQWRAMLKYVDHLADDMTNAQGLVAFKEARGRGESVESAAMKARELTVDFARKGRLASYVPLFDLFGNVILNTAESGAARVVRSRRMKMIFGATAMAGAMATLAGYLLGGNDADGTPNIEKVGDWTKRLHIVLPFWHDKDGKPYFTTVPLPYFFAMPYAWGATLMQLGLKHGFKIGKQDDSRILGNALHATVEAMSPFAQEETWLGKVMPEPLKPPYHVAVNKNFAGFPVHPPEEPWSKGKLHSEQAFRSTPWMWRAFAEGLYKGTGLDAYPGDLREVLGDMFSSQERIAIRTGEAIKETRLSGSPELGNVPLVHRFVTGGKSLDKADSSEYHALREEAFKAEQRVTYLANEGRQSDKDSFVKDNRALIGAAKIFHDADKSIGQLTKRQNMLDRQYSKDHPGMSSAFSYFTSDWTKRERAIDDIEQQKLAIMRRARKQAEDRINAKH